MTLTNEVIDSVIPYKYLSQRHTLLVHIFEK
jgi:hypothetical protein